MSSFNLVKNSLALANNKQCSKTLRTRRDAISLLAADAAAFALAVARYVSVPVDGHSAKRRPTLRWVGDVNGRFVAGPNFSLGPSKRTSYGAAEFGKPAGRPWKLHQRHRQAVS